jgi:phosphatidylethanolamine/phosphatidyl-N-methylethanolamine N-methyltransferase
VSFPNNKFSDEIRFFKKWIKSPKSTGSIVPTGPALAKSMASYVDINSSAPVLELGPGTGTITEAILDTGLPPEKLTALEYSSEFVTSLKKQFPKINLIQGDAFDLETVLPLATTEKFGAVISALPLLNFEVEQREQLIGKMLDRMEPNAPFVQFSYGAVSPLPKNDALYSTKADDWIVKNIPPARVWVYRRV